MHFPRKNYVSGARGPVTIPTAAQAATAEKFETSKPQE